MIKKFYYNKKYELTFDYGQATAYYNPIIIFKYYEPYGEIITDPTINDYINRYEVSDLADYGISWDGKWYYDQQFQNEVLTPYTVQNDVTFYANTVDQVEFGIKIKGSVSDITINSLGAGVTYIEPRSYIDNTGCYIIASVGTQTDADITCSDASVEYVFIPASITDLSNLTIGHNTVQCTLEYNGTQTQFLQIIGLNSIWSSGYLNIVKCLLDNVNLTYDFTNNKWVVIS